MVDSLNTTKVLRPYTWGFKLHSHLTGGLLFVLTVNHQLNAVCGNCKVGAYEEPLLSMCKPCSTCCNDDKDVVISQCQVPGIPANEQCSFARSGKCSKVAASASVSPTAPTMESNHSAVESTIPFTGTSRPVLNSVPSEPITALPYDTSPSQTKFIAGSVFGGVFVIFILPLAFVIRYTVVKRRKTRKLGNDLPIAEIAYGERPEQVQDERHQANAGDRNEADHPKSAVDRLEETTVPVQETKLPGHNDTGKSRLKRLPNARLGQHFQNRRKFIKNLLAD